MSSNPLIAGSVRSHLTSLFEFAAGILEHIIDPVLHFPGRRVGESDGQDMIRFHIHLFDQIGDAHRQNAGFTGTGTRDDAYMIRLVDDRLFLIFIQL